MLLTKKKKDFAKGFSLVEMMVVVSILGVIGVIASGFLFTSLQSSGKSEVVKEIRQNGAYAISIIEGLVRSASSIENCSASALTINSFDGGQTTFNCDGGRIASNSSYLTGESVSVSACTFSCTSELGLPPSVSISFTVSQPSAESLRAVEKASETFQTVVNLRNY